MTSLHIRISLIVLIFFAVFSFAAVEPWSALVLQTAVFLLFTVYLFCGKTIEVSQLNKALLLFFAAVIVFGLIQCLTEQTVLDGHVKRPISLSVLYTTTELIFYLLYLCAALLCAFAFNSYRKIKILLLSFAVCGTMVVITANIFPSGEYLALFRHLNSAAGSFGPFVNRNHAGAFIGFCFFCALALFAARHFEYYKSAEKNFLYKQLTLSVVCALLVYGVIFTRSRGAMLFLAASLAVSAAVFIALFIKNKRKKIIFFAAWFFISASIASVAVLNVDAINKFSFRSSGTSEKIRIEIYKNSLNMLKEYPVFGVGAGAFSAGLGAYGKNMENVERVHNDWLEFVVGTGVAGAVFALFFVFTALFIFVKRLVKIESSQKRAAFLGLGAALFYMASASFVDFHFHIPASAFAFFIIFGALSSETFGFNYSQIRINAVVKILIASGFVLCLVFTARQSAAWYNFFMGASLSLDKKIEYYEKGLPYYKSSANGVKLAVAYYDAFLVEKDLAKKEEYAAKADALFVWHLQRYPADANMLRIKYQMRSARAKFEKSMQKI
ncbi:MAG: O-antigen ligase family protein [Endomicrobium sp.]|jgi:O-antigen ligase|nr:O-antigen ligase family protein [Endomicrobium sp.]